MDENIHMLIPVCVRGSHMRKKFVFRVFEQYLFTCGDSHMGICSHFVHIKFANGDPHMQKCLKMHISDRLFSHNEVVRVRGLTHTLDSPPQEAKHAILIMRPAPENLPLIDFQKCNLRLSTIAGTERAALPRPHPRRALRCSSY